MVVWWVRWPLFGSGCRPAAAAVALRARTLPACPPGSGPAHLHHTHRVPTASTGVCLADRLESELASRIRAREKKMPDNVLILGAGASHDAGVPLMAGLVEKMWEYAIRGMNGDEPLSPEDRKIFEKAMEVRYELDGYHGRATFDDRNIEDILSILEFNLIGGRGSDRAKLDAIIKAMARTIELSCTVRHDGRLDRMQTAGPAVYRNFWHHLFKWAEVGGALPTIITFNYDLVLERSLLQLLVGTQYNRIRATFPFPGIILKYYFDRSGETSYRVDYVTFGQFEDSKEGTALQAASGSPIEGAVNIEILKLHGSLNFAKKRKEGEGNPLTTALADPYILPPIFDKLTMKWPREMWKVALERLRGAKNIIIIGYSLPETDVYMQYFLKTAVGPNIDLNKIYVFDPVLFEGGERAQGMVDRYLSCFAPQMRNRIVFHPARLDPGPAAASLIRQGTFEHFVNTIGGEPGRVFF